MLLYLIRHAQSANNELYTSTGSSEGRFADPPLTDLGHKQAQRLADFLVNHPRSSGEATTQLVGHYAARHDRQGFGLTHLYCSLMNRAVQTGGYIATATGLPLTGWLEVHERGGLHNRDEITGEEIGIPGPNRSWFAAEYPHLILPDLLGEVGWWNRPPEQVAEAIPRARAVWTQLMERHGGTEDRIAVITHAGFLQSLMAVLLSPNDGFTAGHIGASELWFGMSNVSISRLEIDGSAIVIRYLNRVDFLPDELISG